MSQWNLEKYLKIRWFTCQRIICFACVGSTMRLLQYWRPLWVWRNVLMRNRQVLLIQSCKESESLSFCGVGFISLIHFLIFSSYLGSQTSGLFCRSGKPPLVTSCEWRWTQTHASQLILQAGNRGNEPQKSPWKVMVEEDPFLLKLHRKLSWPLSPFEMSLAPLQWHWPSFHQSDSVDSFQVMTARESNWLRRNWRCSAGSFVEKKPLSHLSQSSFLLADDNQW